MLIQIGAITIPAWVGQSAIAVLVIILGGVILHYVKRTWDYRREHIKVHDVIEIKLDGIIHAFKNQNHGWDGKEFERNFDAYVEKKIEEKKYIDGE